MDPDLSAWLDITARWIHVFAGILWVGQTYFFAWLDGRFREMEAQPKSSRNVWMVHSGGFYVVEKQGTSKMMSGTLHWFKWEAAVTWLSGIVLLVHIYYLGGIMVDTSVAEIEEDLAILLGIGMLSAAWPIYELIWRSPLGRDDLIGAAASFFIIVLLAYGLTHVLGGRAAYLHVGAMFGTVMTANVWFTIIPAQKKLVAALQQGKEPDMTLSSRAKACSKHNTFMVVPVVFIMISNHFPTVTYGTVMNWLVLVGMILLGFAAAFVVRRA